MHHKHISGPHCLSCDDKLKGGHPVIVECYDPIRENFPDCHISWCFRGKKDQDEFAASHHSELAWPLSRHNIMLDGVPRSEAYDLFQLSPEGIALFPVEYYDKIFQFVVKNSLPLERLKPSKKFVDIGHFQLKRGALK